MPAYVKFWTLVCAFVSAAVLAACTANNQVFLPGPGFVPGAGRLYAANAFYIGPSPAQSANVSVFAGPFSSGTTLAGTVKSGLLQPIGAALDPTDGSGKLFVADIQAGNIPVFARPNPNGGASLFTLVLPTSSPLPVMMGFDAAGSLFVPNGKSGGKIYQFPHPVTNSSTASALPLTGFSRPNCAAIDLANNLYTVDDTTTPITLLAYGPSHSGAPTASTQNGLVPPFETFDCAVDPRTQRIYVVNWTLSGSVVGYATPLANGAAPVVKITWPAMTSPIGLGFDAGGNLYVEGTATSFASPPIMTNVYVFNAASLSGTALTPSAAAFFFSNGGYGSTQLAVGP